MTDVPGQMHPQLTLLMELQDLRGQVKELAGGADTREVEEEHFHMDPEEARVQLQQKIAELEDSLSPVIRARYDQILPIRERVIVPVINGVCYGCFVSIPTATAGDQHVHEELLSCQSCGCFLYVLH